MDDLSPRIVSVIQAFAETMEVEAKPSPDGTYNFSCSRSGLLTLAAGERPDRVLVCLSRRSGAPHGSVLEQYLRKAGFDDRMNNFMHCGLEDEDAVVLAFEFSDDEFDLQALDGAVQKLIRAME